jgi:hypothetical protein
MADVTTHVVVYELGPVHCSVCAPVEMTADEIEKSVNMAHPVGADTRWHISDEAKFADGLPHPRPCDQDSTRIHRLLDCLAR